MANIKISELNPLLTVEDADVLPIVDNAVTKKVTAAILRSYTQGNSVLLTGAQTIAGIKTFTSQLASSVATGTAPFSVASTTKVTNLNADLLDGLSSAAFQGALTLTTTGSSGASTLASNTLNVPNYTLGGLGGVPYTGATSDLDLGNYDIYASKYWMYDIADDAYGSMRLNDGSLQFLDANGANLLNIADGTFYFTNVSAFSAFFDINTLTANRNFAFPNASGTLALTSDLSAYVPTTRTVSTTSPLAGGGALSGNLTLSIGQSTASTNGYLSSADWTTFNAKQNAITLTTTGTSGAATLVGSTLNIPNYADTDTGITSLNGLTALTQTFAVGTSGTDFGISSASSTHTFNLPTASATNRGALSSADWTTFNGKQNALTNPITGTGTTNYLPKFTGASALGNSLFYDDGTAIGLGTITPLGLLHLYKAAATTRMVMDGDAGQSKIITYRSGGLQRFGLYVNNTAESGANVGSDFQIRAYSDAGTLLSTPLFIKRSTGNVGIGTTSPAVLLQLGDGSLSNITINQYLRVNAGGYNSLSYAHLDLFNFGNNFSNPLGWRLTSGTESAGVSVGRYLSFNTVVTDGSGNPSTATEKARFAPSGNLLLNTTTDSGYKLDVNGTARVVGAATFASSVSAGVGSTISGAGNSDWGLTVENTGTTNAHGLYVNIGESSTGIPFRVDKNNAALFNIANSGAATFSADATINGVKIGKGAGNQANNTALGALALFSNTTGDFNTSIGRETLNANTTGIGNTAVGRIAIYSNTTGSFNTGIGLNSLYLQTTASSNSALGSNTQSGNYSGCVILGRDAEATNNNQFVVGSSGYPSGAVTTEVNVQTKVWNVIINGVAQKILLA